MNNNINNTSSVSENPSPEADRGIELEHPSFMGDYLIPYGYYEIIRFKKNTCKINPVREFAIVRCPLTATCDTQDVANRKSLAAIHKNKRTKTIENIKNKKIFSIIEEQGGMTNAHVKKMIDSAILTQRLSDNNVGGGLGKKKRLNRMIAQGSPHRYSGAKKKCPKRIEEELARTSSKAARDSLRTFERAEKHDIQEQSARVLSNDEIQRKCKRPFLNPLYEHTAVGHMQPSRSRNTLGHDPNLNNGVIIREEARKLRGLVASFNLVSAFRQMRDNKRRYPDNWQVIERLAEQDPATWIEEQAYGFSIPKVPVEAGENTLDLLTEFIGVFKDKKVELSAEATEAISVLAESVRGVSNPNVTHSFKLPSLPSAITSPEMRVFWVSGLLMVTFAALGNRKLLKALLSVTAIAALWFPDWSVEARTHFDAILAWAKERLNFMKSSTMVEVIVEHSGGLQEQGVCSTVIDSIIGFMYYSCFKSLSWQGDPLNKLSAFFERTKNMRKVKEGLEFTFSSALTHIQVFLDWISERFGCPKYSVAMDSRPEITIYSEKVTAELKLFAEGKILNAESAKGVMVLYTEGKKIAKSLPSSIEYQDSRRLVQLVMNELTPLVMKIQRSNLHNMGPRIQPIGVLLTGPSGVGKTTALTPLMLAVTANVLKEEELEAFRANHNDFIYNRISENEYYDSYHGQMNVIFDDFGQQTDSEGVPCNQYMEFIRMVNSNAMDLHMAHLDDKGVTTFRSKAVYATSNVNKFRLKSIVDPKALCRRFMCSYVVYPAVGYREDPDETDVWKMKLKTDLPQELFSDDTFPHLIFQEYDAYEGRIVGCARYSMEDVIERVSTAYRFTQTMGAKILDTQQAFKEKYLERRAALAEPREEGSSVSVESLMPIFPGESMTSYVSRLMKVNKLEFHRRKFEADRLAIVNELDILSDSVAIHDKIALAVNSYKQSVYDAYCKLYDVASNISFVSLMKTILAGLATFTAGFGIYKLLSGDGEIEDQSPGAKHQRKAASRRPNLSQKNHRSFVRAPFKGGGEGRKHPQLAFDATCDDIIYKIYKKNVYTMHQSLHSDRMGCVTFIGGHDAFMPRHFAENVFSKIEDNLMSKTSTIVLRAASNPELYYEISWSDIKWFFPDQWEDEDVVFAQFPNVIPQAPNIRKYVMEDSEVISQKFSGKMLTVDNKGTLIVPYTYMDPYGDLCYTNYINPVGYSYDIPTRVGHCGNLVFVSNPLTGTQKLIGFHVAGAPTDGKGYATRMTRSLIDLFDEFAHGDHEPYQEEGAFFPEFTTDVLEPASFKTLYKDRRARPPMETSIVKSPLHGTFAPSNCAPAMLKSFINPQGETVDPWLKARAKYARSSPYMNQHALAMCTASYGSYITSKSTDDAPWTKKVFSFEDAVQGVPGVPNCEGIPRNTSAGYPFTLDVPRGSKYKYHFFGSEGEYEFTSQDCALLKRRVENIIAEASRGNRLKHVYLDFLKDERRPLEKVSAGSTRLISACPVDLLIALRMYFLDFMRWFMSNRLVNGSAVGINVFSSEWGELRRLLRGSQFESNLIAGDFQAYDACQTRQIQVCFLRFVNSWYNDGNDLIRSILFEDICNSKHIYQDIVYEWPGGNPSGNPLTTILNTFNNNVLLRYAGLLCHDEYEYGRGLHIVSDDAKISSILSQMEHQAYFVAYGDDNLVSVGKDMRLWYNQHSLTRAFDKIGFTYTSEAKDGLEVEPLRSIDEVSFLKRSWKYDPIPGVYVAALEMSTILESAQWTKKKDKDYNDVRINVCTILKELSAHGDQVWDNWYPKIVKASQEKLNYVPPIPTRRSALALQLSRDDYSC